MRTINSVIQALPIVTSPLLPAPLYTGTDPSGVMLAVSSMKDHTTDEGWQIAQALEHAGYKLVGHGLPRCEMNTKKMVWSLKPGIVVMQDKREWDFPPRDFRDPNARFGNVAALKELPDIFKLTILKDAHQRPDYHRQSAEEIGCHAWIVYYHPRIVKHVAPYVRPEHLVRTYHTVDPTLVPPFNGNNRMGCLLSGAISTAYPLRKMLVAHANELPQTTYLQHPGYHRNGCATPLFLRILSQFKVAICTSSIYGYSLRKIIEATAAGCIVMTDLPSDEILPDIDGNLARVDSNVSMPQMVDNLNYLYKIYDPDRQSLMAKAACKFYDYCNQGMLLAENIERLRSTYNEENA